MTAQETIIKYLKGRKTGATVPEIVAATGLNKNTVRRIVGGFIHYEWKKYSGEGVKLPFVRKCRQTGVMLSAYGVQS